MVIIEELKHNRHENVSVPRASDLFQRVGQRLSDPNSFSGDEFLDPSKTKISAAKEVAAEVAQQEPDSE